ncbi:MAG: hypothetical protein EBS05_26060 [Proteobacteria bacterium]|nr:hypothetical protein [Pseudomonadota bacterium]
MLVGSLLENLPPHRYRVYGLTVAAWIPFPELPPAPLDVPVDAVFRLGEVPAELPEFKTKGARFRAAPGKLLVWIDTVARYLVRDGNEIIIQPMPGAEDNDLRELLLCSPMGALLHQRGLLPLHASAIATPQGAVVFMAHSGRGKSTLAAHFRQRGFKILADDVAVVSFDATGRPQVAPGYPQFKLWPDSVAELGHATTGLRRFRTKMEKFLLAFPDGFQTEPLPIARLYVVEARNDLDGVTTEALSVPQKLRYLLTHTYRAQYVPGLGRAQAHFQMLSRLAATTPATRVSRPDDGRFRLDQLAEVIAGDFTS